MTHTLTLTHIEHVPRQSSDHHTAVERASPPHTSIIKVTAKVTAVVTESLCFNMNTIKTDHHLWRTCTGSLTLDISRDLPMHS